MSKLFIWLVPFQMWLWRARSFIFRFHGPLSPSVHLSEFRLLPREFTYSWCRFHLLCKQNKQTMRGFPTIPENNSSQQHSGSYFLKKKKPGECSPCAAAFPHFYCPPGKGWCYGHMFPLDLISSFLLKIHPKQHLIAILESVLWIFLCFVCAWFWGFTPNILLNWCVYLRVGGWVHTYMHHTHICAIHTHTHTGLAIHILLCLCEKQH